MTYSFFPATSTVSTLLKADPLDRVKQLIGKLQHFDHRTAGDFKPDALHEMLMASVLAVASFSNFAASGRAPSEFTFDEFGIACVEQYVDLRIRPGIAAWGGKNDLVVTRVITEKGTSSSAADLRYVDAVLIGAGLVLGQCLAQILDARWVRRPGFEPMLVTDSGALKSVRAIPKVRKYCRFGSEDSLLNYAKALRNHDSNMAVMERNLAAVRTAGFCEERDVLQWKSNDDGAIVSVQICHPGGALTQIPLVL